MHSHRVLRRWLLACYKSKDSVLDIQQRLSDPGKPAVYRYLPAALGLIAVGCHRDDLRAFKLGNALILEDRRHYGSPVPNLTTQAKSGPGEASFLHLDHCNAGALIDSDELAGQFLALARDDLDAVAPPLNISPAVSQEDKDVRRPVEHDPRGWKHLDDLRMIIEDPPSVQD